MLREKAQGQQTEAESTNALIRVGLLHSSDEGPVMGLERREQVIEIALGQPKGRSLTMQWGDGIPRGGTSRKMREYQIRFCEKLSVKFTGLTRQFPVAAGKAANLVGERPMPSIARFGRLAYPMRGEVTNRAVLGRKRHGRPGIRSGWPAVGTTWVAANSEA
jgi:hypothetical protein